MKTYNVINVIRKPVKTEVKSTYTTRFAEAVWTMSNGLEVRITCWTFLWDNGTTTKEVSISPWNGYYGKSFVEVQDCLWQALNLARKAFSYGWNVKIDI